MTMIAGCCLRLSKALPERTKFSLQDLKTGTPPVELTSGKDFLYSGEIFRGKLYITTNEGAPHFHLFVVDAANPKRANWKEIIPASDAILKGAAIIDGKILAQYEKNASSQLKLFDLEGKALGDVELAGDWVGLRHSAGAGTAKKRSLDSSPSLFLLRSIRWSWHRLPQNIACGTRYRTPGIDPSAYRSSAGLVPSKDGTKFRCSFSQKRIAA